MQFDKAETYHNLNIELKLFACEFILPDPIAF